MCHAPKPSDAELTEERLRREASTWCLLSAPSLACLFWESLHWFKLLPCWSAAGWRPPASYTATACPGPWSPPLGWEAAPITEWRLPLRPEEWLWSLWRSSGSPGDWGGLSSGAEGSVGGPSCRQMDSWSLWPWLGGGQPQGP